MTSPGRANAPISAEAQARLAGIEEVERRTQVTVDAVEQYAQQLRALQRSFSRLGIKQEIDSNLGFVFVNGNGDLVKIDLSPEGLRSVDASLVGHCVLAAIKAGQSRVKRFRDQKFKELADSSHLYR
ncbi:YbaB/EbfC family nucleoid-associated protein [Actinoallomurus spadix]|uniref:Uncharacterized protein n=1 Tax=Actinoallomurus spadix TaxID=79912 RepID=A0ABN0VT82_9ACTN